MFRNATPALLSVALLAWSAPAAESSAAAEALEAMPAPAPSVDWSIETAPRLVTALSGAPEMRTVAGGRPALLPALYVGLASLQAFDAFSTRHSLARGAAEANPVMRGVVRNKALLWGVKAGMTVGPVVLAERMWRKNRVAAVVLLAAINGVQAAVAMNNARVMGQLR